MRLSVTVTVLALATMSVAGTNALCRVTVNGETMKRGQYSMTNNATLGNLLKLLDERPSPYAKLKRIMVIRNTSDGRQQTNVVDASAWRTGSLDSITFPLQDRDRIDIPPLPPYSWM